jgi:hypothetical protein
VAAGDETMPPRSLSLRGLLGALGRPPLGWSRLAGLALVCVVAVAYGLTFWNAYLGVSVDGWFFHFGQELRRGVVPYRDYFFWTTPFHIVEQAIIGAVFGPSVAAGHLVGAALRVVLIAVVYLWFTRRHSAAFGVVVSVATLVVGYDDNSEPLFYYTQQAVLYGVVAGYLAAVAHDRDGHVSRLWLASGLAAGFAIITKHTIGAGAFLPVAIHALVTPRSRARATGARRWLQRLGPLGAVSLGAAVPVVAILLWLGAAGALGAFFRQVLFEAPEAKGPVLGTLGRMVTVSKTDQLFSRPTNVGVVCLAAFAALRASRTLLPARLRGPVTAMLAAAIAAFAALAAGAWAERGWPTPRTPQLAATFVAQWGCLALMLLRAAHLSRKPYDAARWQRSLFASTGFFLAYSLSLSWGLYEQMVIPGLACVMGEVIGEEDEARDGERPEVWCAAAACLLVIATGVICKRTIPYDWAEWREPPLWDGRAVSALPELRGMALSASTTTIVDRLTQDIEQSSAPGESVFVYPYFTLLYELSHRRPDTFGRVHWFDVAPDSLALADAQRLIDHPPRVIVMTRFDERFYVTHERLFRGGGRSGQRAIEGAVQQLLPLYDAVDEISLPYTRRPIVVLRRKD